MKDLSDGLREILEGSNNVLNEENKAVNITKLGLSDILVDAMRSKLDVIQIKDYIYNKLNAQADFLMDHIDEKISTFTKGIIVGELKMACDILKIVDPEHAKEILDITEGTEIGKILGYNPDDDDDEEDEE